MSEFSVKRILKVNTVRATAGFDMGKCGLVAGTPLFFDQNWDPIEDLTNWSVHNTSGTQNTVLAFSRHVASWVEECGRNGMSWKEATFDDFRALRKMLDDNQASSSTIKAKFSALSNFYCWAVKNLHIKRDPFPIGKTRQAGKCFGSPLRPPSHASFPSNMLPQYMGGSKNHIV